MVLGCSGSVGTSARRLLEERHERFDVVGLSVHRSLDALYAQAEIFKPDMVCASGAVVDPSRLPPSTRATEGALGIVELIRETAPDLVLNAITGAAGLAASEATLEAGIDLALANKESLVMAGPLLMEKARNSGASILPVDSEHCALFQCLIGESRHALRKLHLTASGGPFRERAIETMAQVTIAEALAHPTWDMGPRISIGSATMMNKAFEVLEARWLFDAKAEEIGVFIHPQSVVHSMVEFVDGSVKAQLGAPDMRVPILFCLGWPDRLQFDFTPLPLDQLATLTFEAVDFARFPAIPLAYEVLERGGDSGAVLNAADEVFTQAFLDGQIPFSSIVPGVARTLQTREARPLSSLEDVIRADTEARNTARTLANTVRC